jgi:hypothetical protein
MLCVSQGEAEAITINSTNDGMLDQHVNYNTDPVGVAAYGHHYAPAPAQEHIVVGRRADDYGSPDTGPSMFGAMKFDISSLAGKTISSATLRLVQTIDATSVPNRGGDFAATTEVYGVDSGDYDESTATWQNYVGGVGNPVMATYLSSFVTALGTMNNVSSPGGLAGPGGVSTFSNTNLTNLVQQWIDSGSSNLGLLLVNSASLGAAPAAPKDVLARYAAHESPTFDGPQLIVEIVPEPSAWALLAIGCFGFIAFMRRGM